MNTELAIYLLEDRASDAREKYPSVGEYIFKTFVDQDPSGNNKYLMWLMKQADGSKEAMVHNQGRTYTLTQVMGWIKEYDSKVRGDINSLSSIEDLRVAVENREKSKSEQKKEMLDKDTEVLHDGDRYRIVMPKSHEAMKHWGASTSWCVATSNTDYWPEYYYQGAFVVVIDKWYAKNKPVQGTALEASKVVEVGDTVKYTPEEGVMYGGADAYLDKDEVEWELPVDYYNYDFSKVAIHMNSYDVQHFIYYDRSDDTLNDEQIDGYVELISTVEGIDFNDLLEQHNDYEDEYERKDSVLYDWVDGILKDGGRETLLRALHGSIDDAYDYLTSSDIPYWDFVQAVLDAIGGEEEFDQLVHRVTSVRVMDDMSDALPTLADIRGMLEDMVGARDVSSYLDYDTYEEAWKGAWKAVEELNSAIGQVGSLSNLMSVEAYRSLEKEVPNLGEIVRDLAKRDYEDKASSTHYSSTSSQPEFDLPGEDVRDTRPSGLEIETVEELEELLRKYGYESEAAAVKRYMHESCS